ncbi:MAG: amino acid permease [Candidatus Pseudobacter hemicellulosilyticus]|uniref:Amino acid permease n=1 Tax=Candidatus Pseudobacter hemicellulosilyticus TaxID=3121375 RepID=A0AAJ5WNR7_9BACT|nr:MAG: amino acid permease [Pseudobacter sp.]
MSGSLFRKKSIDKIIKDAAEGVTDDAHGHSGLRKILTVRDLTFMGIAAVVGAGIFSTIGSAAADGGPGISLLFVITAITCGFSALCYAEFASRVPIAGSAYTYAYVTFGELVAWIIGWALILEYAIGNIVVAISWSTYFNNLLQAVGIHLPGWLTTDPATAEKAFLATTQSIAEGKPVTAAMQYILDAWNNAPQLFGGRFIINLPAFIIVALVAYLTYVGIKETKRSANFMVVFKIAVIIFVIIIGCFFVEPSYWDPFLPNKMEGVLKGVSAVFYAYIGFDAISTTAEECKNPQRDMPRGMIYSLLICTGLYILIALVLTGMVPFSELKVNDPLSFVFERVGQPWISRIVDISAVVATTSVLLVFQLGQPRIWMSMSRDGLLPKAFGKVHPRYQTPWFSTIVTGILVAVPALFMQSSRMTDLTSIGTLFAFVLVSGGVLLLPKVENRQGFKLPYINGKFIVPVLYIIFLVASKDRALHDLQNLKGDSLTEILFLVYLLLAAVLSVATFLKNFSLIPILGVLCCAYLLIEIPAESWIWFFCWMGLGLMIYFLYGYRKSKLAIS